MASLTDTEILFKHRALFCRKEIARVHIAASTGHSGASFELIQRQLNMDEPNKGLSIFSEEIYLKTICMAKLTWAHFHQMQLYTSQPTGNVQESNLAFHWQRVHLAHVTCKRENKQNG